MPRYARGMEQQDLVLSEYVRVRLRALIARSDPNGQCGKRLSVKVSNASARTVKRVRFFVHMYEPGRSTDFASYEGHLWDRVLGPGEARTMCFEFPPVRQGDLPDEAVAVPEKRAVEFYEPGEYIPR